MFSCIMNHTFGNLLKPLIVKKRTYNILIKIMETHVVDITNFEHKLIFKMIANKEKKIKNLKQNFG